jgi:MFS family permease
MRPLLASIAPVLPEIIRDTGLSHTGASLLTALPVLCLGLFAPAGPLLARSIGAERAVVTILMVLAASALLRSLVSAELLLFSALSAGAASGMLGALLPGMVKQEFPDRVGLMMGLYVTALCGGIAMASGATVPLQSWFGGAWNWALTAWGGPALIAAVLLWLQRSGPETMSQQNAGSAFGLWRDTLAWQVTFFMAFQLAITYCAFWMAGPDPARAWFGSRVGRDGAVGVDAWADWGVPRGADMGGATAAATHRRCRQRRFVPRRTPRMPLSAVIRGLDVHDTYGLRAGQHDVGRLDYRRAPLAVARSGYDSFWHVAVRWLRPRQCRTACIGPAA